jgi:arabinan endo-1,5-alpha-L-arabinosidase
MLSLLVLLSGLAAINAAPLNARQAASWPDPQPCSGNCSGIHDPSIVHAADGTWWLFSTNGDISIASAPAITGPWTYKGPMLPNGSSIQITSGQQLWVSRAFNAFSHSLIIA